MSIEMRKLTPAELPDLLRLWRDAGLPTKPAGRDHPDRLRREMESYPDNFIGAFVDGRLVGSVLATWDGRKGWINRVAVLPECRRQGIGQTLIKAAEEELEGRGALIIAALIEVDNTSSRRLFERTGYADYGEIAYVSKRKEGDG